MPQIKRLTDRDHDLLVCLSKCGVMNYSQVKAIYKTGKYHYARLQELEKRRLVKSDKRHIEIMPLGMQAVGNSSMPIRINAAWKKERQIALAEIYVALTGLGWEYLASREIKKQSRMSDSSLVNCYVQKGGQGYAVYLLSDKPRKSTIRTIKTELKKLWMFKIDRAIIFAPTPEAMNAIDRSDVKLDELLVLPYPYGITLLAHKNEIDAQVRDKLPGFVPSGRPFADYESGGTYASVLTLNNVIKKEYLQNYLRVTQGKEGKKIIIVCLDSQSQKFGQLFPGVEQIVISSPPSGD